jgi:hypothetical protein
LCGDAGWTRLRQRQRRQQAKRGHAAQDVMVYWFHVAFL